ncbi:putative ribonuclease H-like domain-containing protein [Tanacetum coccineum]|uniref:Ribonuclease H-like domain-containing protein n=1 Tax=Tanacetum coccineum TaxID=301880 RepID=A0ABQ5IEI5_9ASTR
MYTRLNSGCYVVSSANTLVSTGRRVSIVSTEEHAPTGETSDPPAPKTVKQLAAKRNQERVKSILLLAIPDEYFLRFHNVKDAKSLWAAIKSRFGGNEESKKMQKNSIGGSWFSNIKGRYQPEVSKKSLPSWNLIALIMRNKPDIDEIDIDDLYNNLRVYEDEMKKSSSSTSTSQNLAFLSSENTSSTNEVSTASGDFWVSIARGISQVSSTPCAHDVSKIECYNYYRKGHFSRECRSGRNQGRRSYGEKGRSNAPTNESSSQALVAQDGLGGYDWSNDFEVEPVNYALMAISSSSSSSSSDNEVQKCSKQCLESFQTLQKNYDSEREKHSKARIEIQGYELALESLESRILVHQKNELAWGEKYDQMSAIDKTGIGYGTQLNEMSNNFETDSEISLSIFDVRSSNEENAPANDWFSKADGFHVVSPPITGNFLTLRADISFVGLDEYAIRKKIIESKTTDLNTKISETVGKTNEAITQKPKTVYESANIDKVIIEDWNSDDEDDVSEVQTVSPVKTNETQTVKTRVDKIGQTSQKQGIGFKKIKACFVCKRVLTRTGLVTLVKKNEKIAVYLVSTDRPVSTAGPVSTVRPFAPKIAQTGGAIRPIYPRMDNTINGGFVAFGSDPKGGKITGKGKIRTANLDFDDVYFVDEHKFNLFFVSQMCDKRNGVLITETECLILSPSFKLLDESQVVLRAPRKDDVYSLDLKKLVPSGGITCLYANATADESKLWHRRLGHVNFKNINKLVKGHLVRGLPSKVFVNDHTCVAYKKGKQHKASCKAKCDNGTEFKNHAMNDFCAKPLEDD